MDVVRAVVILLRAFLLPRAVVAAEILALRHQLGVPQRSVKRPRLRLAARPPRVRGNLNMPDSTEPRRLRDGERFHKRIQKDWKSAEGNPISERRCTKPDGSTGRIDVHVNAGNDLVAIVEIKNTDWDRMTDKAVRRNVRRQARQIWKYIEPQLEGLGGDERKEVCPGGVLPARPTIPGRLELIEELSEAEGIPVIWDDESIEERRAR